MLAIVEGHALALRENIGLESFEPWIIVGEGFSADRILDAPIDHVAEQGDTSQLYLELGIGFRMRIGTIRMAHVAGDRIGAAKRLGIMKNALAFGNETIGRVFQIC